MARASSNRGLILSAQTSTCYHLTQESDERDRTKRNGNFNWNFITFSRECKEIKCWYEKKKHFAMTWHNTNWGKFAQGLCDIFCSQLFSIYHQYYQATHTTSNILLGSGRKLNQFLILSWVNVISVWGNEVHFNIHIVLWLTDIDVMKCTI